ncbi:ATP-dependent Clp protease ATP-binding subunit CLPT1, chloroplastic [Rhodamnia argentea]|uniref:ATP-dependent Clp protease ATP-binding subunit CLPT1, chloroplastic n=1 Tax=Rhodamnia argentea TaxID=178133 RepID=A0A8B8PG70_9MYRT|nr:ATP-dependent Clp protease ATP-binding subunit CLPT1, chloroplastic [Rhodamnia argentea]
MAARSLSVFPNSPSNPQSIPRSARDSPVSLGWNRRPSCLASSFNGNKLSVVPIRSRQLVRRFNSTVATVLLSLPTGKPERAATDKLPKWSARAIKSFAMAELEARKLKYPNTGTEALLMGILVEGTSLAAKFLRANGITLFKVREETVNLLGKSDMYFFSPEHPPLTEQAQRALDWAVDAKLKSGESGEITTTHLLLGIWSEKESAGHKILSSLGFTDEKAEELGKSMDKDVILSYK